MDNGKWDYPWEDGEHNENTDPFVGDSEPINGTPPAPNERVIIVKTDQGPLRKVVLAPTDALQYEWDTMGLGRS